jgi:dTDP-4-dehydrorhamnose reductase
MKTILITGSSGQLGQAFQHLSRQYREHRFLFASHQDLDITDSQSVLSYFEGNDITICINCAAYTGVDKAESERDKAFEVNVQGAVNLTNACLSNRATLVHFSTDFVFDGKQSQPYSESDVPNPMGVYGQSKLEGERYVLEHHPHALVIRTSWVYSLQGHNFLRTMIKLGEERDLLNVVFDQVGTPTFTYDLARHTLAILLEKDLAGKYGLYHYSNEGVASWYDFAKAIMEEFPLDCEVLPIESRDFPTPASRPAFSVLNKSKIKETFDLKIPHWRVALRACLKR